MNGRYKRCSPRVGMSETVTVDIAGTPSTPETPDTADTADTPGTPDTPDTPGTAGMADEIGKFKQVK